MMKSLDPSCWSGIRPPQSVYADPSDGQMRLKQIFPIVTVVAKSFMTASDHLQFIFDARNEQYDAIGEKNREMNDDTFGCEYR